MLEGSSSDKAQIRSQFTHLENTIKELDQTKQNKIHAGVLVTVVLFFLAHAGIFLWYGGVMVGQIENVTKHPYSSIDYLKDSALSKQRMDGNEKIMGRMLDRQDSMLERLNMIERTIGFK